jgi:DNA-binding MarR family transcriptional regulator
MPLRFILAVHRATHRIGLHIQRFGPPTVSQGEAHILTYLDAAGDSTIADVHRAFGHKRSTLTSILDRLEERALIVRKSDARDRRTFVISLTAEGRRVARRITEHLKAFEARILKQASASDVRAFLRVLDAVDAAID